MDLPIVCTLSSAELQTRREGVLRNAAAAVLETRELPSGFAYRFAADAFSQVTELIHLERACCPFLTFKLTIEPANGPLWFEVTGPIGSKEFLSNLWIPT